MNSIEFKSLILDDAPMERASFDVGAGEFKLEVDTEDDKRVTLLFKRVMGMRFTPSVCFDRRSLYVEGCYIKTVIRIDNSQWIKEVNKAEEEASEPITKDVNHYVIPSDDGVWEILASKCGIKEC